MTTKTSTKWIVTGSLATLAAVGVAGAANAGAQPEFAPTSINSERDVKTRGSQAGAVAALASINNADAAALIAASPSIQAFVKERLANTLVWFEGMSANTAFSAISAISAQSSQSPNSPNS
ncbi:MAG: hypothetical protein Q4G64_10840, partial [bacterium]|nr:hypothetical protein [bacterium]